VGSADAQFLLPLGFFGFALCLLRERTGSLYPCMALHCINNSIAFGSTQNWDWQILPLLVGALGTISLAAIVVDLRFTRAPA
jgi:membrane protease YdiL (CAAX protease family)